MAEKHVAAPHNRRTGSQSMRSIGKMFGVMVARGGVAALVIEYFIVGTQICHTESRHRRATSRRPRAAPCSTSKLQPDVPRVGCCALAVLFVDVCLPATVLCVATVAFGEVYSICHLLVSMMLARLSLPFVIASAFDCSIPALVADFVASSAAYIAECCIGEQIHISGCRTLTAALAFHIVWYQHGNVAALKVFAAIHCCPPHMFRWTGKDTAARVSERLRAAARRATDDTKLPGARCTYVGGEANITSQTVVPFEWQIDVGGVCHSEVVSVRADHALQRGLHEPKSWIIARACSNLDAIAQHASVTHSERLGLDLSCSILGQRTVVADHASAAGNTVALITCNGERMEFLLCAHIYGDRWLCHRGTLVNGKLDCDNPFSPDGLAEKDVVSEAFVPGDPPLKRITRTPKLSGTQLQEARRAHNGAWDIVVATALVKSAEIRKRSMHDSCDTQIVGFERDPFKWAVGTRQSHLYVAWAWQSAGMWQRAVTRALLDNVMSTRQLPLPPGISTTPQCTYLQLMEAAARQKAPCRYLGLELCDGSYEPDPANWQHTGGVGCPASHTKVYYEWVHVLRGTSPYRVCVHANHAVHRAIPGCPLNKSAPSGLCFSMPFMDTLAESKKPGTTFKGIVFDTDRPEIIRQMPNGGIGIQDEPVYWVLPCGRCECWSMRELAAAHDDHFAPVDSNEAYRAVAREFGYDVLGVAPDSDVAEFRDKLGTIADRRWAGIQWRIPPDESCPCWWITNPRGDVAGEPKLLSRSLVCLRLELHASRCATSSKLRHEWERRLEDNARAVDTLEHHPHLWKQVAGPEPALLLRPSAKLLEDAQQSARKLEALMCDGGGEKDGLDSFIKAVVEAVAMLAIVSWDAIHKERFWISPDGLFSELVRNAEQLLKRHAGELERRRLRLSVIDEDVDTGVGEITQGTDDIYGLCLDEFKGKSGRKPHGWSRAIQLATELHLDEIRTLLEMHYDECHMERWKHRKKAPPRDSKHYVYPAIVRVHLKKLNQRLCLPTAVKSILRQPSDEADWGKLEQIRLAILAVLQCEGEMQVDCEDSVADVAAPSQRRPCPSGNIGGGSMVRPISAERSVMLDKFGKAIAKKDVSAVARSMQLSIEDTFDRLMIVLWDVMFFAQSVDWSRRGFANTNADETLELGRWFMRGQKVGKKPIFDGICSFCGTLLHGDINDLSSLSNKRTSPPVNRDGEELHNPDGSVATHAQPPFLLRYSPALFAKEAPAMFEHDPTTNRLSLKGERPWVRPTHGHYGRYVEEHKTWLYCGECKDRLFPHGRPRPHIPFRDRAAQCCAKRPRLPETISCASHSAPRASTPTCPPELELPLEEPAVMADAVVHDMHAEGQPAPGEFEDMPEPGSTPYVYASDEHDMSGEDVPAAEVAGPIEARPTLTEYEERWAALLAQHSQCVDAPFSDDNLVPVPDSRLWQDCPYVPFDKLQSDEAQARLSVCRPISGLETAKLVGGVPTYAHNTGEVNYRRRAPLQLASTMGFVLNKNSGRFMKLTPDELAAEHECLSWGRQHDNNRILQFFGTTFEAFHDACAALMCKIKSVIPEGSTRARIRATRHDSWQPNEGELGDTLGDEAHGMVVVDAGGHPLKYDALSVMESVVATQHCRLEVDAPGPGGKGWRLAASTLSTDDLGEQWRTDLASGARHVLNETWVPANDPHYDAKCWPCVHPYGTGSLLSEPGAGGTQQHARNRLTLIQSWFRRSALWGFWFLDRLIKTELYFKHKNRQQSGMPCATGGATDPYARFFGTALPGDIPETSEWWKRQQRDLLAMSDDAELGLMQAMVTVTANDSSPEMLAAIRRGPFAAPTDEESIEYLLTKKPHGQPRPEFEQHSLEHVLSFQRRVHAIKTQFMKRGVKTPLGRLREWWDRTEAQMRAALHAHILCWFCQRPDPYTKKPDCLLYTPVRSVPRVVPGDKPKQRPADQHVDALPKPHEDDMYHTAEMARVTAEMVRPNVSGANFGGYDVDKLRIAGLARTIQSRLLLHCCNIKYCLKDRSACRFFFPWPCQPHQCYDENTERVALQRRLPEDDQWLNPHNLYLAMFSPATVHVLPFDPRHGADQARQYACKYASKPEKWYHLETEHDGVKDFLKCRTVGLCMSHNRLLGFHVVRSTRPVQFIPASFLPNKDRRTPREPSHVADNPDYPDTDYYLSATQKYFFRAPVLRHLRVEQYNRYFTLVADGQQAPTAEDTIDCENDTVEPDLHHRHYDALAEGVPAGTPFPSTVRHLERARKRRQARLGVSRTPFIEPIGADRERFYESRLVLVLPWYCGEKPSDGKWSFRCDLPVDLPGPTLNITDGVAISFEQVCANLEATFCSGNLVCACCAEEMDYVCKSCRFAVGFHRCRNERAPNHAVWRKCSLHGGQLDVERVMFNLHRKGVPLTTLRDNADAYVAAGLLAPAKADTLIQILEAERSVFRMANEDAEDTTPPQLSFKMTGAQLAQELVERENKMQAGSVGGGITDQWRVYQIIVGALCRGEYLRLMVQASAGTGHTLITVLYCTTYLACIAVWYYRCRQEKASSSRQCISGASCMARNARQLRPPALLPPM